MAGLSHRWENSCWTIHLAGILCQLNVRVCFICWRGLVFPDGVSRSPGAGDINGASSPRLAVDRSGIAGEWDWRCDLHLPGSLCEEEPGGFSGRLLFHAHLRPDLCWPANDADLF